MSKVSHSNPFLDDVLEGDIDLPDAPEKHTPGPWFTSFSSKYIRAGSVKGWNICAMSAPGVHGGDTPEEVEANARLIAASPKMLETLQWVEKWIVRHGLDKAELLTGQMAEVPILCTIRSAIATATHN